MDPVQQPVSTPPGQSPIKPPEIEQKPSHFLRNFLIVSGIFFFLIGVSTGAYFLGQQNSKQTKPIIQHLPTPTSDPTTSWKTYTNSDYNFLFKYPPALTFQKEDKYIFDSTNFDEQKILVTQYAISFTTGKIAQSTDTSLAPMQDISWLMITVTPTNGKTIKQAYDNKKGFGENTITKVTMLQSYGNADEIAEVSNIEGFIRLYRKGDHFFQLGYPQDGSGEITSKKYLDKILTTFKFTK